MRPSSSTTTSSASEIVDGRWAMMKVVRPRITSVQRGADLELGLDVDAAVASSRIRMRGSMTSARAMAMRWRWPPVSVKPRSPMTVS